MSEGATVANRDVSSAGRFDLDLRALAVLRIGLALWFLSDLVGRWLAWGWLYGERAIPSSSSVLLLTAADTVDVAAPSAIPIPWVGLLLGVQDGWMTSVCLATLVASCVCLGVGLFSRISMAVLLIGICAFATRQPLIVDPFDGGVFWWAVVMWLMPLDARWSLAARGGDRVLTSLERSATVVFIALISGSLALQGLALFGAFGDPAWHLGWRAEVLDGQWGVASRICCGVLLCSAALAWSGLVRGSWIRSGGSLVWVLVAVVSATDGGHAEWLGWTIVLAVGGLGGPLFTRWGREGTDSSSATRVGRGASRAAKTGWDWALILGGGAAVAGSLVGLVRYERAVGDALYAPEMWAPRPESSGGEDSSHDQKTGSRDASPVLPLDRWGFVVWRGAWVAPAQTRRSVAEGRCVDAVGLTADGGVVDLLGPQLALREESGAAGCEGGGDSARLSKIRRHPWTRRVLLTDLARRAWQWSEENARVMTVELRVVHGNGASNGEQRDTTVTHTLARPPDGAIVGDFR